MAKGRVGVLGAAAFGGEAAGAACRGRWLSLPVAALYLTAVSSCKVGSMIHGLSTDPAICVSYDDLIAVAPTANSVSTDVSQQAS